MGLCVYLCLGVGGGDVAFVYVCVYFILCVFGWRGYEEGKDKIQKRGDWVINVQCISSVGGTRRG